MTISWTWEYDDHPRQFGIERLNFTAMYSEMFGFTDTNYCTFTGRVYELEDLLFIFIKHNITKL